MLRIKNIPSSLYPSLKPTNPSTRINFVVNKDYFNPKTYYNYENLLNYEDYYEYDKFNKPDPPEVEDNDLMAKNNEKQIRDNLHIVTPKNSCAGFQIPAVLSVLICELAKAIVSILSRNFL
jgi:hypothetical protein